MPPLPPAILTIFGITGDLAQRKLLPALYYLAQDGLLPTNFKIVGVTRKGISPAEVIERIDKAVHAQGKVCEPAILNRLQQNIAIVTMNITESGEYLRLKQQLDEIENQEGVCLSRLFYLAIPAQMFAPIIRLLGANRLNSGCQHNVADSRLMIEKPLGHDLASAAELMTIIGDSFTSKQLFLIDHYLAKEPVRHFLTMRFGEGRLESHWNSAHISHLIIRADETLGIEGRVVFYEELGALRDMVQSHLMQLLSLATMEEPADNSDGALHAAKLAALNSVVPLTADTMAQATVRGQYDGYRQEVNNLHSQVETFAALKFELNNNRWQNLPVLLKTGKQLGYKRTEIKAVFKDGLGPDGQTIITIKIDPNDLKIKDAYEIVLCDAMRGDHHLFVSPEEVLASWRLITPILDSWAHNQVPLDIYQPGSDGPLQANELLKAIQHG